MHLIKANPLSPFYPSVQSYFETNNIIEFTPEVLRKAVVEIRQSKLPNPKIIRNNGSFFANPIISEDLYAEISENYENIPHWPTDSGQVKMSGAWLIEQSGYKNVHDNETGMATWENQPLVLVNEHAKSTADVLAFKQKIVNAVSQKFGITLVQEPELLP
jgi:UDP-N-acetylmuramate dehydrogenase